MAFNKPFLKQKKKKERREKIERYLQQLSPILLRLPYNRKPSTTTLYLELQ